MLKKEIKKGECPKKKHKRIHTKKGKIEEKKKTERKDEHAKTYKCVKMSNKKVKSF